MLNLNQVRVFYHVAKNLSFTSAAKELLISQPAVTAQVKAFGEYCDLNLFKKRGRGIRMTDEGRTIFNYIRPIFEQEKEVENVIEDLRALKRGVLRLGTSKSYARYIMPGLVRKFHEKYCHIEIHLDEGSSAAMIKSICDLKNEVALIAKVIEEPDVEFIPFSEEELIPLFPPDHPLAQREVVTFEEIAQQPIIMKEVGSVTRKLVDDLFKRHDRSPRILMETSNAEFIMQVVERGDGISFLVKGSVVAELEQKKLVTRPILGESMTLGVNIAYLKNQPLSPSAKAFLAILEQLIAEKGPIRGIQSLISKERIS